MKISGLCDVTRRHVQLVRPGRASRAFLISLLMLITPLTSSASGNVAPVLNTSAPPYVKYDSHHAGLWDTPEDACKQFLADSSWSTWGYVGVEPIGNNMFKCLAGTSSWICNIPAVWSCDGSNWSRFTTTCTRRECPANATGSPTIDPTNCTCDDGYAPDPTGTICVPVDQCPPPDVTDPATGQCVKCPIEALKPLPQDACTQALENLSSTQAQKDAACGKLSQAMEDGKTCLEEKLSSLGTPIPLSVGVGVRSDGYQKHFVDIWNQMEKLVRVTKKNPIMQAACAARRAEIAAEKGCDNAGRCVGACTQAGRNHCLRGRPSSSNTAPHTMGNAIDVSESRTIKPLRQFLQARKPPQDIQQFLDEPPEDCKLKWGGTFTDNYDPIHFQVR